MFPKNIELKKMSTYKSIRKDYNNKIIITSCNDVMKNIQETKQANKNIRKQKFIYLHNSCNSYL